MNYSPLTDFSSSSFSEVMSVIFSNVWSIALLILAFALFFGFLSISYISIKSGERILVAVSSILAAIFFLMFLALSSSSGFSSLNTEIALENIQEKYNIEELEKFVVESDSDTKIYSGNYYNLEDKTVADLSIMFDKETGEPTILTNAQVSEEFVKSLEK